MNAGVCNRVSDRAQNAGERERAGEHSGVGCRAVRKRRREGWIGGREARGTRAARVALAQACVRSPRVLIADELTDTLDLIERNSVLALLQGFAREGVGVLMTATDAHGAVGCTRLLSLSGGRLIEVPVPGAEPAPADPGEVVPFRAREHGGGRAE
jgi:ABC-type hemin transport system ATPase subunit